jgi:hypothetical protein
MACGYDILLSLDTLVRNIGGDKMRRSMKRPIALRVDRAMTFYRRIQKCGWGNVAR